VEPPSRITGSRAIGTPFLCDQCSFYPTRRLSLMACRDRSLPECVEPFYVLLDELGRSLESATLWARMGEGNKAHRILEKLMLQSTSPDMLSDAYSQVDGHLWVPAAIAEMLLQSQNDDIVLLPALHDAWLGGSVRGMKARQAVTADFSSKSDSLRSVVVHAKLPVKIRLRYRNLSREVQCMANSIQGFDVQFREKQQAPDAGALPGL
jgi:hypothetical protein